MLILKEVRKAKQMTLEELAAKSGISKRMISVYESNKSDITYMKMKALADALGVGVLEITSEFVKEKKSELTETNPLPASMRNAEPDKDIKMYEQMMELYRKQIQVLEDHNRTLKRDSQVLEERVYELKNTISEMSSIPGSARSA